MKVELLIPIEVQWSIFMQGDVLALFYAVGLGYAKFVKFLLENLATMDLDDEVRRTDMIIIILK